MGYIDEEVRAFRESSHFREPDRCLKHACHVIYWSRVLDEYLRNTDPAAYEAFCSKHADATLLRGIRYARNRATHQLAELLVVRRGGVFPRPIPLRFFEIVWRASADLPTGKPDPIGESAYKDKLEGRPVRFAFKATIAFFAAVP